VSGERRSPTPASEIIDAAGDERGLRSLQSSRLIPVELMLIGEESFPGFGPATLAGIVLIALDPNSALRDHRSTGDVQ
jgi:hypothetical protein